MNDDLLINNGDGILFGELLERIGDIHSSEKAFWRKATHYSNNGMLRV